MSGADEVDESIGASLEDFLRRRERGEAPRPEEYRDRLGNSFAEFAELVAADATIEHAMEAATAGTFPRPFGAYELLEEIGRGANGTVYRARRGKEEVVLKVLRPGLAPDPVAQKRFQQEVEVCRGVKHHAVVELLDSGTAEGARYYAMRKIECRPLDAVLRAGELTDWRAICAGMADVADALAALHAKGVVHRDVKPSNILVASDGRFVLCDFGLAHVAAESTLTRSGEALGTPRFMSPEQMLAKRASIGPRTDVYGLGATLHELLARAPVFEGRRWQEIRDAVLKQRPRRLRDVAPGIPAGLESLVQKALEKRPEDRPASAEAVRDELRRLLS